MWIIVDYIQTCYLVSILAHNFLPLFFLNKWKLDLVLRVLLSLKLVKYLRFAIILEEVS